MWSRVGSLARLLPACLALLMGCGGPPSGPQPAPWRDLLARVESLPGAKRTRQGVEANVPAKSQPSILRLLEARQFPVRLEGEVLWRPGGGKSGGGFAIIFGPHVLGTGGYRIAVGGSAFAESRSPRPRPGRWHRLEVRAWGDAVEIRLDDRLVARSPARNRAPLPVELAVEPGTRLVVRSLRIWSGAAVEPRPGEGTEFAFPPDAAPHRGRVVADAAWGTRQALEVRGAGLEVPLVWGHDLRVGTGGPMVARFNLRGVQGNGQVRLAVVRANGQVVAETRARVEELPTHSYRAIALPFRCEPGWVVSLEVSAEAGVFRLGDLVVSSARPGPSAKAGASLERPRRARKLSEVWKPDLQTALPLELVRLERRLTEDQDYEFRAVWRLRGEKPADEVAIDLWVATRDQWGLVWLFDCAAAYDRVGPGEHTSGAVMPARLPRRYGSPVALFAMLYYRGEPAAGAWRKWGIPVDDKYILGARRAGELRRLPLIE